jgi:glucose-fructose oxidoreductase
VGQGHFAQTSILPAFAHARESCELTAIFSGDEQKRRQLARRHRAEFALPHEELDDFLRSGAVQAVYLAVPNHLHKDLTLRAARAGVHVLCEKPMAVTARDCRDMIAACDDQGVKLMVAYRLHLERANLTAVDAVQRGRLGEPRYFSSMYSFQLDDDNVRGLPTQQGGGPLYDIGIYCINAARYLFGCEPSEAAALVATGPDDGAGERGAALPGRAPGRVHRQLRGRLGLQLHRGRKQGLAAARVRLQPQRQARASPAHQAG